MLLNVFLWVPWSSLIFYWQGWRTILKSILRWTKTKNCKDPTRPYLYRTYLIVSACSPIPDFSSIPPLNPNILILFLVSRFHSPRTCLLYLPTIQSHSLIPIGLSYISSSQGGPMLQMPRLLMTADGHTHVLDVLFQPIRARLDP